MSIRTNRIPRWLTIASWPGAVVRIPVYFLLTIPLLVMRWREWLRKEHNEPWDSRP